MAWTTITEPAIGDATKKNAFAKAVIDNLEDLNARVGTGGGATGLPNSSFEDDSDSDGEPDGWTITETGGTQTLENDTDAESYHGAQSIKFTYPASASGGGYMETTDFIACSPDQILSIAWKMKLDSSDGAKNIVRVYWYDYAQAALTGGDASTDAYSDTGAFTSWTQCFTQAQAPTNAKYFKIRVIASDTSATPSGAGAVWFDDFRLVNGPGDVFRASIEFKSTGTGEFTHATAQLIWVEAWGGGGNTDGNNGHYGAGGGEYAAGYFVTAASTSYNCVVGAGGAADLSAENDGADSTFNSTTVVASGGTAGNNSVAGAGGTGGTGQITIDGQTGEAASSGYGGYSPRGAGGLPGGTTGNKVAEQPGGGAAGHTDSGAGTSNAGGDGMIRLWFNP